MLVQLMLLGASQNYRKKKSKVSISKKDDGNSGNLMTQLGKT
jgi:hypothetical protein